MTEYPEYLPLEFLTVAGIHATAVTLHLPKIL